MKIAYATQNYNRKTSGAGVFAVQLAEGMAQAGHQVLVLAPSESHIEGPLIERNGVRVANIHSFSLAPFYPHVYFTPFPDRQIGTYLDQFRPDVVHIHDHYPLCASAVKQARKRNLPLVGTDNFLPGNMIQNVPFFTHLHRPINYILWKMVLNVFNQVDHATAATETAAAIFRKHGMRPPLSPISCGVDRQRFHPDPGVNRCELRRRYGIQPEAITILYLGRLENEKRVDLLIRAFAQLDLPDVQLVIGGHGIYAKNLIQLARESASPASILFTGYIPDEDIPGILNSVDYFAMPGDTELQSLATLEAMACGRPVLAANARALPELVKHKRNGYLFKSGDVSDAAKGIRWLVDQKDRWNEMSAASLEIVEPHALTNTIASYINLYHSL